MINTQKNNEIKKFSNSIREGYSKRSYKYLCRTIPWNSTTEDERYLIQIGVRVHMDDDDFNGHVDNTSFGEDLGESLSAGEFNHIIAKLKEIKNKEVLSDLSYNSLLKIIKELPDNFIPKYILLPLNTKYDEQLHMESNERILKYDSDGLNINIHGFKIKVIWSTDARPFDEIYLLGEGAIEFLYKDNLDMNKQAGFLDYNYEFDHEPSPVSIKYKQLENGKIDIYARVVCLAIIKSQKTRRYTLK